MKILNIHHIDNYARCERCKTEMSYDKEDLYWDSTDYSRLDYYYIICPVCNARIWIKQNEELDKMFKEKWK